MRAIKNLVVFGVGFIVLVLVMAAVKDLSYQAAGPSDDYPHAFAGALNTFFAQGHTVQGASVDATATGPRNVSLTVNVGPGVDFSNDQSRGQLLQLFCSGDFGREFKKHILTVRVSILRAGADPYEYSILSDECSSALPGN